MCPHLNSGQDIRQINVSGYFCSKDGLQASSYLKKAYL